MSRAHGLWTVRSAALAGGGALALSLTLSPVLPTPKASAATSVTFVPSLRPDRLGASGAMTLSIRYAGEAGELEPSPVRGVTLHLPAGLGMRIPKLRSCAAKRLRALGARGCPAQSRLGTGYALVEARPAAAPIRERVSLTAFLGPPRHLLPTLEVLAEGQTPIERRIVLAGTIQPDHPPYGEALLLQIPPIHTQQLEPDASIIEFSLTVGAGVATGAGPDAGADARPRSGAGASKGNVVVMPRVCPSGGFPFAGDFTFADGSRTRASASFRCPR